VWRRPGPDTRELSDGLAARYGLRLNRAASRPLLDGDSDCNCEGVATFAVHRGLENVDQLPRKRYHEAVTRD